MQRPRRTSEFHEELDIKRQSRQNQRGVTLTPSTAQKMPLRQSRLTVPRQIGATSPTPSKAQKSSVRQSRLPTRPSSNDRATTTTRGVTPQKTTPLSKGIAMRDPFTAEKPRGGAGTASLHNDKKWIQEQTQRITDYLREATETGSIPGINQDFFTRSGLRQMSIKQFVAIINYFLHFIWGSRFTVGANHVEDIVNILQKLNYPHPITKSWLKTPNTQHSFGNVIVLLDFLMDFAPAHTDDANMEFEFEDPQECTTTDMEYTYKIPDIEFQDVLLKHCEGSFKLWDKNLMDEYAHLKKQTCDLLIQKQCGVSGIPALDEEIEVLKKELSKLEKHRVRIPKSEENQYYELEHELKKTSKKKEKLSLEIKANNAEIKQLEKTKANIKKEISQLQADMTNWQAAIREQICNVEQREKLLEKAEELKRILKSKDREFNEIQNYNHQQQVLHVGAKKQLTTKIEHINSQIREVAYSALGTNIEVFEIPINVDHEGLKHAIPMLKRIRKQLKQKTEENDKKLKQYEAKIQQISNEIETKLSPQNQAICNSLSAAQKLLEDIEQQTEKSREKYDKNIVALEEKLNKLELDISEHDEINTNKNQKIKQMAVENEQMMSDAEKKYHTFANAREDFLNKYEEVLDAANAKIVEIKTVVDDNNKALSLRADEA